MKIVGVSNFDIETMDDILVCENVHKYWGEFIVEALNDDAGEHGDRFFKLVEDDYKLHVWEP